MASGDREAASAPKRPPGELSALLRELVAADAQARGASWEGVLRPGLLVGRFELVRELGRGGFGVVYEARDRELHRPVAFKAVRVSRGAEAAEDRLLAEAEVAARLAHPNIVTLHDVGRSEHGPYLVMELLRGETLARHLEQGPLGTAEALRVAAEVARGLAHAHAHGVIHRDLTPGNVFLCQDGQVKLLDLGLAQAFGRRKVEGGTPAFMAPEQRRGAPEDERTDVFALGVLLHRMLAGAPLGASRRELPPLEIAGLPALGTLVARMVEADPVRRPRDASEVAPVLAALHREAEHLPAAAAPAVRRHRLPGWLITAAAALALLAASAAYHAHRPPAPARQASIAVLPFANLSADREQEFFSDGLTEEIMNTLARVQGLRVAGRTSSFAFKGKAVKLADLGRELGVSAVLEGSVRKSGSRVRITAQVVNVGDGFQLWSQEFDRELADVFAVQDEIARAVVRALEVRLVAGRAPPETPRTASPDAHLEVLIARKLRDRSTREADRRAVEALERAVSLDPQYATAWAELALATFYASDSEPARPRRAELQSRSRQAAERAVALAPDSSDALASRAKIRAYGGAFDWSGSEADLAQAVALAPSDAWALCDHAETLAALGRLEEALVEAHRAADVDPLARAPWAMLGKLQTAAGELAEARRSLQRAIEIAPDTEAAYFHMGTTYLIEGRPGDMLAWSQRSPGALARLEGAALAMHDLGRAAEARAALEEMVSRYAAAWSFQIAEVHAWYGDADAAFGALERARENLDGGLSMLTWSPLLRRIRDDARYPALLRRLNLPSPDRR
ncbi:MAG TPA: protein kinase [Anaeromyxobacteraceae bacterium]